MVIIIAPAAHESRREAALGSGPFAGHAASPYNHR